VATKLLVKDERGKVCLERETILVRPIQTTDDHVEAKDAASRFIDQQASRAPAKRQSISYK
jgi:hypothetical protein